LKLTAIQPQKALVGAVLKNPVNPAILSKKRQDLQDKKLLFCPSYNDG
jgi:hypothetical protein